MNRIYNEGFEFYQDDVRPMERLPRAGPYDRMGYRYYHPDAYQVSYHPVPAGIFNIYLFDAIESAEQFIPAIEALHSAGENDRVVVHLSTPGGSLDATDTFLDAMRRTDAHVIVNATGGVHSAGTIILLHADEFYLSENFNAMVHNGSYGSGGKYSDVKAHTKYTEKYMEGVLRRTYEGFLTPAELDALIEGKDFWMDAQEFGDRFERKNLLISEKIKALQEALEEDENGEPLIRVQKPKRSRKKMLAQSDEA